jgi:hypothetical protein
VENRKTLNDTKIHNAVLRLAELSASFFTGLFWLLVSFQGSNRQSSDRLLVVGRGSLSMKGCQAIIRKA